MLIALISQLVKRKFVVEKTSPTQSFVQFGLHQSYFRVAKFAVALNAFLATNLESFLEYFSRKIHLCTKLSGKLSSQMENRFSHQNWISDNRTFAITCFVSNEVFTLQLFYDVASNFEISIRPEQRKCLFTNKNLLMCLPTRNCFPSGETGGGKTVHRLI